jgi:dolichol-phosphate mannosyltransferase
MKIVIIIPTFNERENILALLPELDRQFCLMAHECHILVVDDNSPDGTAIVVRALQQEFGNLHLITGEKNGLGAAYIRGMMYAMETLQADVVFEMDADFSHKPEDVPRLMAEVDVGADFVIGSRYVPGGTIPKEWAWHRKLNSWGGNAVARNVAGIYGVRDCTAGFRAIRTTLLRKINLSDLRVQGYAFQVSLLHAAKSAGACIKEIPVEFVDRTQGESKLGLRDIFEFVINAWWIRFHSSKTFIKFAIVGLSGVAVNLFFFTLFLMMGMNKYLASPLAIELSVVSNFLLNNYWTFRWRKTRGRTWIRGLKFNMVSLLSLVLSYGTFILLSLLFPLVPPQIHQFIGIIPATLVNYFLNSYWTFRQVEDADEQPRRAGQFAVRVFLAECAGKPVVKIMGLAALYVGLLMLVAYPLVVVHHPPLQDYPNHLARMYILQHPGMAPLDRYYQIDWNLIPNLAMDATIPLLGKVLTLAQAGKAYILLTFILLTSGPMFLHWVLYRKLSAIPLIAFLFLYNMALQKGFLNFLGGCGLALWALAVWLWMRDKNSVVRLTVGIIMSGLVYFAHLHAFAIYAITVIAYEIASINWRSEELWQDKFAAIWPALLQFAPWAVLFLSVTAPGSGGGGQWSYGGFGGISHKVLVGWTLLPNFHNIFDLVSTLLLVAGSILVLNGKWVRLDARIALGLSALLLLVFILPEGMLGGVNGDWRLFIPIVFIASGAVRIDRARGETYEKAAMAIIMLFFVVMLRVTLVTSQWKVADRFYTDFVKVVQFCETETRLFSAVVNMSYKDSIQLGVLHLPAFGVIERQLFVPFLFTGAMQQPIKYRADMMSVIQQNSGTYLGLERLPCELIQREYDYLLLINREDDGESKACGLQRIRKSGALELYRVHR